MQKLWIKDNLEWKNDGYCFKQKNKEKDEKERKENMECYVTHQEGQYFVFFAVLYCSCLG